MRRTLPLLLLLAFGLLGGLWYVLRETSGAQQAVRAALAPLAPDGAAGGGALPARAADGTEAGAKQASLTRAGVALPSGASDAQSATPPEEPPPRVVGRLIDERDEGVAGARVDLRKGDGWISLPADLEPVSGLGEQRRPRRAETDAEGRFVFEGVEPGDYDLALRAAGFAPLDRARQRVPVHERFDLGDFVLRPGVALAGRVVDAKGAGVPDVLVLRAASPEGGSLRLSVPGFGAPVATSAADGAFRIDTLAPGSWHLIFDSAAHRIVELQGRTERAGEEQSGLLVRLDPGLAILGRVVGLDPLGRALRVVARPTDQQPSAAGDGIEGAERRRPRTALVAADGSFGVLGLAPSLQYRLRLEREREPDLEAPPDEVPQPQFSVLPEVDSVLAMAGAREVVLERVATASVSYRLVDDGSGAAVVDAYVSVQGEGLRGGGHVLDASGEPRREHPDGRVRHDELRPALGGSTVRVQVNAEGFAPYDGEEFVLRPGEERALGELRLARAPGVSVRVVDDASELPIAGARVLLAPASEKDAIGRFLDPTSEREPRAGTRLRLALTDADGRCRITASASEVCVLRAAERSHLASEEVRSLPPHDAELLLRLAPAGSVVVRVVDPRANPIAGVYVRHEPPGAATRQRSPWDTDGRARQTSDEAGLVRFERLESGSHRFVVGAEMDPFGRPGGGEPEASEEVVVREGVESTIELRLGERGGFRAILLEAGVPLAGAFARLSELAPEGQAQTGWRGPGVNDPFTAISDHEGRVEFSGLAVQRYELSVTHPERRMAFATEVQVEPGPREVRIELGLASIEGRVTGTAGEPLQGQRITISSAADARDSARMDFRLVVSEDDDGDANFDMSEVGERRVETDSDGRYVLRGVRPDAELTIQVQGEYVVGDSKSVAPLSRDEVRRGVDFSLRAAGQLEISLTGLSPADRGRYGLRLAREGEERAQRNAQVRGSRPSTVVASLLPGSWKVEVFEGGQVLARGQAEVVAGEVSRLSIQVR